MAEGGITRELSKAEQFALLPLEEQTKILAGYSRRQRERLEFDWRFWGRPTQFAPTSRPWDYWLILAGRGFGKTRTGAEWVRDNICGKTPLERGRWRHIALIAETAADARDVMVGDGKGLSDPSAGSGLLQIHPKDFRPLYEPSKRRLTWPNGAVASIYNGTEPDQLRGPQHDAAWCLVGDTAITMADGSLKPISEIVAGEFVATRNGAREVVAQTLTSRAVEVFSVQTLGGKTVIATANHPIFVDGIGFVPVRSIKSGMRACVINVWSGAAEFGTDTAAATTKRPLGCTAKFGLRPTVLFQKAITFIIRTAIRATIVSTILNCYRTVSIVRLISKKSFARILKERVEILRRRANDLLPSACDAIWFVSYVAQSFIARQSIRQSFAQARALRRREAVDLLANSACASIAVVNTKRFGELNCTVLENVIIAHARLANVKSEKLHVPNVASVSTLGDITQSSARANAPCVSMETIVSVEKLPTRHDVFDLAIAGEREFFANGVLVHNCDELAKWRYAQEAWDQLQFGMRTGENPQVCITTTPRPIMLLKELIKDSGTIVTTGSTFDNAGNLSAKFLSLIKRKYENTRLGRQELYAELLEDAEGALWKRSIIDALRVKLEDVPPIERIVIAVDPAASSNEDSNENGIVCVGLGVDKHGYVLDDVSGVMTPAEWGAEAISLYRTRRADRIVAETNNGGDMVENTIRMIDPSVSFGRVWASRGKWIRAEPVSALYEQGRVHHVGTFARLEDQMCSFTVDFNRNEMGYSPDRMDALVWALTELMVEGNERRLMVA